MSLVWREQLSVGNNVIDSDHMYLIEIVNQIERSLEARNLDTMVKSLDLLSRYSQEHFVQEEKIARIAGYTGVEHMHQSHVGLVKQLDQVKLEIAEMGQEWSQAAIEHFTTLLRNWLLDHVIKEDLLMKPALQKFPPDFDPK